MTERKSVGLNVKKSAKLKISTVAAALAAAVVIYSPPIHGGEVNTFQLKNGLKVIHRHIPGHPVVAISVFAGSGSLYEPKNAGGITYLTQSLLTKGTKSRTGSQIADDSEKIGISIAASADKDYAMVDAAAAAESAAETAALMADVIINPVFPKEEFDKEKAAAIAAARSRKDRIFTVADDLSNEIFYGKAHPYSAPETGTEKSILKISRTDVIKWHARTYTAGNMVITVAGDISADDARTALERSFGEAPSGKRLKPSTASAARAQVALSEKRDFRQAFLMLSYPAPRAGQDGYAELKLIAGALGSRMSGRLFRELREKLSLAYEVNAIYPTRVSDGKFTFYIGLDPSNVETARRQLRRIISEVRENGLGDDEIAETKRYLAGIRKLQRQTASRMAFYDGFWTIIGKDPSYDEKLSADINALGADSIRAAARKYFDAAAEVEILITPSDKPPTK
jgi:predicted Zn-dependent peptidase